MNKKLSIITICYNTPDIEDTCKSVANQTWQDFEWIVIDGGSADGTVEILKKYEKHMTHFISEKDSGIYNAMNKGIRLAKGEYLLFLNGGDYLSENNILQSVFENSNYCEEIVYGNFYVVDEKNNKNLIIKPKIVDRKFLCAQTLAHQASFIKRGLFDKFGLYNENYRIVSDWELWVKWIHSENPNFRKIDFNISCFKEGGISSTNLELLSKEMSDVQSKYYTKKEIYLYKNFVIFILGFPQFYLLKITKNYFMFKIYILGMQIIRIKLKSKQK